MALIIPRGFSLDSEAEVVALANNLRNQIPVGWLHWAETTAVELNRKLVAGLRAEGFEDAHRRADEITKPLASYGQLVFDAGNAAEVLGLRIGSRYGEPVRERRRQARMNGTNGAVRVK